MKIAVIGDTHGDTAWTVKLVYTLARLKVKRLKMVVVGDFGLYDHFRDGVSFLDVLNEALREFGITMYVLPGNHENHDHWEWYVQNLPKDNYGFTILRTHIRISAKTHAWQWAGKKFGIAGGAVSVDKYLSLKSERDSGRGPRTEWWDNEELTDADVHGFNPGRLDYLFTHDCSGRTPFKHRIKDDIESRMHRQRIDDVLFKTRPRWHFHGHMHEKYEWTNWIHDTDAIRTIGLDRNTHFYSWGILDTEASTFAWRGQS